MGVPDGAPYDRIEATVGVWDLSMHWLEQLRAGGLLVVPLWLGPGLQASVAFQKRQSRFQSVRVEPCGFIQLRGPHAGPERHFRVNDWFVGVNEVTPEHAATLRDLLLTTPRAEPAPELPQGAFIGVALGDPFAISLQHCDDWRRQMTGILDVARKSLAVVEGRVGAHQARELLTFGGDSALIRLREWLARAKPLDLRELEITAVPAVADPGHGDEDSRGDAWMLHRPSFQFAVRSRP